MENVPHLIAVSWSRRTTALPMALSRARNDSLLRNSLYMMATTLVNSFFGYLFWIIAARTLAPDQVGLAAALVSAITLTSILSSTGIGSTLVQLLPVLRSDHERARTWSACMAIGLVTSLLACGASLVILPLLSPELGIVVHQKTYGALLALGVLCWTLQMLLDYTFVAERITRYFLVRNAAAALTKNGLIIALLVVGQPGAAGPLAATVGASAISVLVGLLMVRRLQRGYQPVVQGILTPIRAMASSVAGHHLINLGGIGPTYVLPMLVTAELSTDANAYFYITWMIGGIFFIISPAVSSSLFAEGAHLADNLRTKVLSSSVFITALLVPVMVFFFLGGRYVLALFGAKYASRGFLLLSLLIISAIPDAITNIYVSVLRVRRKLYEAALLNTGMAATTLILAWILLPRLGIAGAGWAWLLAQCAGSLGVLVHGQITHPLRHVGQEA